MNRSLAHASGSVGLLRGSTAFGQNLSELEASARERFAKIKFQLSGCCDSKLGPASMLLGSEEGKQTSKAVSMRSSL